MSNDSNHVKIKLTGSVLEKKMIEKLNIFFYFHFDSFLNIYRVTFINLELE